jgi:hypothetical protein
VYTRRSLENWLESKQKGERIFTKLIQVELTTFSLIDSEPMEPQRSFGEFVVFRSSAFSDVNEWCTSNYSVTYNCAISSDWYMRAVPSCRIDVVSGSLDGKKQTKIPKELWSELFKVTRSLGKMFCHRNWVTWQGYRIGFDWSAENELGMLKLTYRPETAYIARQVDCQETSGSSKKRQIWRVQCTILDQRARRNELLLIGTTK